MAVEFRRARLLQKVGFRPEASNACTFGIRIQLAALFLLRWIMLLLCVHLVAIALVVPPRQAHVTRHRVCARVHVTNHALRRRNRAGELMFDRMARFIFRNVRIGCLRTAHVAGAAVERGVPCIAVIGIDDVTGRTT